MRIFSSHCPCDHMISSRPLPFTEFLTKCLASYMRDRMIEVLVNGLINLKALIYLASISPGQNMADTPERKAEVDNQEDSLHCTRYALAKAVTEGEQAPYQRYHMFFLANHDIRVDISQDDVMRHLVAKLVTLFSTYILFLFLINFFIPA